MRRPLIPLFALMLIAGPAVAAPLAFPGAQGWAAETQGGRGGRIIKVTTLAASGPGSFLEAINAKGPRIVVFEVGGIIDLNRHEIRIKEPYITIAGQTAPSPGITLIKGGLSISAHDVIVRHLRVRVGEAGAAKKSGWEADGISATGAYDVIVDHCSVAWATDENGSASGKRFEGATPDEWRAHTSHRVTFTNNIYAEGLSNATHVKGEHSKGTLIHDNTADILVANNLYIHNMERHPLIKGGAHAVFANNYVVDPGKFAMHYALNPEEWGDHPYQIGVVSAIGNVMKAGASTRADMPFLTLTGAGELKFYAHDNIATGKDGKPMPAQAHSKDAVTKVDYVSAPLEIPPHFTPIKASEVPEHVLANAGARPWDRDAIDIRLLNEARTGAGKVRDSETEVGGYPTATETRKPFDPKDWNLDDMTAK